VNQTAEATDLLALDGRGLLSAFKAELPGTAEALGVTDKGIFEARVLEHPDVRDILSAWDKVEPEWRLMLLAELRSCARDVANSFKTDCLRCGRCCRCTIYVEAEDCERGTLTPEHVEVLAEGRFVDGATVTDWMSVWDEGGVVRLKHNEAGFCIFHDETTHLCTIYEGRANHCRRFFCRDDVKRRANFSFPDIFQHLSGRGFDPWRIALVFVSLRLWRKVDEMCGLDDARRGEFGGMLGVSEPSALSQFLGPSIRERLAEAANAPDASNALHDYAAFIKGAA